MKKIDQFETRLDNVLTANIKQVFYATITTNVFIATFCCTYGERF